MPKSYVLYHADCPDGFCAAYVAWRKLADTAEYIPVRYGDPIPGMDDGAIIYIVDFSYPRGVILDLADRASRLVVLDHHRTAAEELKGIGRERANLEVVFDMKKSGAMLAWEHFYPGHCPPKLVQYVQDRDLWAWALPDSREINAAIGIFRRERFDHFDVLRRELAEPGGYLDMRERGRLILQVEAGLVEAACKNAGLATFVVYGGEIGSPPDKYVVPVVSSSILRSEIGHRLLELHPEAKFAAICYRVDVVHEEWSLRSRGDFDVSAIARREGGGGHPSAAGFRAVAEDNYFILEWQ
jgi:hypothetical protein